MSNFMSNPTFLGLDISCAELQISQKITDKTAKEVDRVVPNTCESIEQWIGTLPADAHCLFEATGVYSRKLEYLLSVHGIAFSKVNPLRIKGYIKAGGSLAKTDRQDARHIRRYGEAFQPRPDRPLQRRKIEQDRYQQALTRLDKQLQDIENQLHVLQQEPIPFEILLNNYLNIQNTLQEAKTQIEAQLKSLESVEEKETQKRLQSIPGIGKVIAQSLVAAIGDGQTFQNAKQLVKFLGLAPVEAHSGTSVHRKYGICRTAVPHIRAKLFIAATSAIRANQPCKQLFLKLRQNGKPAKVARIAVMHKLIRQAFAVLKSKSLYDQNLADPNNICLKTCS